MSTSHHRTELARVESMAADPLTESDPLPAACRRRQRAHGANRTAHRGTLLLAVLVSLIVTISLLTSVVQSAVTSRRQVRNLARLAQVELLLQSGFDRARSQVVSDPEYRGETWRIDAQSLGGSNPVRADQKGTSPEGAREEGGAEITIRIDRDPDAEAESPEGAAGQVATIAAEYPAGDINSVRRTRRYQLTAH